MLNMTLAEVAEAVGGVLYGAPEQVVQGVFSDTRHPRAQALFIALRGARFDGHGFVADAAAAGAAAALVEQRQALPIAQIVVDDTRLALGRLGRAWRQRWPGRLLALTGSNGKTTTKEMLAAILRLRGPTLATRGNLNNDIGVPLMLAELGDEQPFAVIEMGANHPGEIAYLASLAHPDVALITNTGRAHLEGFGGLEGVIRAKGEIYQGLGEDGIALINGDDAGAGFWRGHTRSHNTLTFAMQQKADIQGRWQAQPAGARLLLQAAAGTVEIPLQVGGEHNARNALAAAAAALALGFTLEEIRTGLASFRGIAGRLQRKPGWAGSVLWDDTYNANPDSLRAGIAALRGQGTELWLVLGDMGELGPEGAGLHDESGRLARALGVTRLFALGPLARHAAQGFGAHGEHFPTHDDLVAALKQALRPGVHVLIKGSRASRMERVVQALEEPSC